MTDPSAKRKIHLSQGIQSGLEKLTITLGFASGNSQLFPSPPELIEPDRFSCCPRDQSLFVDCYIFTALILCGNISSQSETGL